MSAKSLHRSGRRTQALPALAIAEAVGHALEASRGWTVSSVHQLRTIMLAGRVCQAYAKLIRMTEIERRQAIEALRVGAMADGALGAPSPAQGDTRHGSESGRPTTDPAFAKRRAGTF